MQRFWSWLAVNLGKHAGIVSIVGLVLTVTLGFGITKRGGRGHAPTTRAHSVRYPA